MMGIPFFGRTVVIGWLVIVPVQALAQHGGHARGHASRPPTSAGRHVASFHAPPYYLLLRHDYQRFRIYLGYPVGYRYDYFNPGGYLDPYSYSVLRTYPYSLSTLTLSYMWPAMTYPMSGDLASSTNTVTTVAGLQANPPPDSSARATSIGEVRLRITPSDTAVFVDGTYVGTANDYSNASALACHGCVSE